MLEDILVFYLHQKWHILIILNKKRKHLCILYMVLVHTGKKKKYEYLWSLEGATERLQLVQADLMEEGSFDNAIMGCKGVFHVASPVLNTISDPKV